MAPKFDLPFTQQSHVVAITCALVLAIFLTTSGYIDSDSKGLWRIVPRLFHILAFSMWLGTQFWVSFVAGITMYANLPRHTFGYVQSKLFPKYFQTGTILMTVVVGTFLWEHDNWDWKAKLQGGLLLTSLLMTVSNLVVLQPKATRLMFEKHLIEKEEQAGDSIGKITDEKLKSLMEMSKYRDLSSQFVFLHSLSAIANLIAISTEVVHLWFLASHLTTL